MHGVDSKATVRCCDFRWNTFDSISCLDGGHVEVTKTKLSRNDGCCILASGAGSQVTMADVTISNGTGTAMKARQMAAIDASSVNVVRCSTAVEGRSAATIACAKSRFEGCSTRACGSFGGAQLNLTDVQFLATTGRALHTRGAGSSLRCVDCKLLGSSGSQALCELGASLMMEGTHVGEGAGDGFVVAGPGTTTVINGCSISKQQGAGVRVKSAQLTLTGSSITECGLAASIEETGTVHLTDARIADCQGGVIGSSGTQISIHSSTFVNICGTAALCLHGDGTHARIAGCRMRSCMQVCLFVGTGARCEMGECTFEHNSASCTHSQGSDAAMSLNQCKFEGNAGPCIRVTDGGAASATGCHMHDTEGSAVCIEGCNSVGKLQQCELKKTGNHALIAQAGGSCALISCRIEASRTGAGLLALGEGSHITCTGGCIAEMQLAACVAKESATVQCSGVQLQGTLCGSGCIATAGGVFIGSDCSVEGNSDHGVMVAEGGQAQLQACRCCFLLPARQLLCCFVEAVSS